MNEIIKAICSICKFSEAELAKRLNISIHTLRKFKNGRLLSKQNIDKVFSFIHEYEIFLRSGLLRKNTFIKSHLIQYYLVNIDPGYINCIKNPYFSTEIIALKTNFLPEYFYKKCKNIETLTLAQHRFPNVPLLRMHISKVLSWL